MSVRADLKIGDRRERIVRVGWWPRRFMRNGRVFTVRNERVWVREVYEYNGWDQGGWCIRDWAVLPRGAGKEETAIDVLRARLGPGGGLA